MKNSIFIILALALLSACSSNQQIENKGIPETLVLTAVPGSDPDARQQRLDILQKYLEKSLEMPVKVHKVTDYTGVVEAMISGKVHLATYGPFSYLIAHEKAGAEAIIMMGQKGGVPRSYDSFIFSYPGSGINSMEDVKEQAGKIRMAFTDPASTSGHLIPKGHLLNIGINPERDFRDVVFAGGHTATVLAVKEQKANLGASFSTNMDRMIEKGRIKKEDVNILWKSEPMVSGSLAVVPNLDSSLVEKIRAAYINMKKDDPESWNTLLGLAYPSTVNFDELRYIPSHDSMYDNLREKVFAIDDFESLISRK